MGQAHHRIWGFGNLYEFNAALGALIRGPRPGDLVGPFEAGSPFYYFVPASPLALVLSIVLGIRTRNTAVARPAATAAGLVTVAATAVLATRVNPQFRDTDATGLTGKTLLWLGGNTLRLGCIARATWLLLSWRRIESVTA